MGGSGTGIPVTGVPSGGGLVVPPVLEPIDLATLKLHLRLDSETFDGNLTLTQSLAYASNGISALGVYTHFGDGIDVLGKQADVIVHHGTNGDTGTVDTKIQESDQLATGYNDWTGGAFAQVSTDGAGIQEPDNADYKKQYTGAKQYIRTASKVLLAPCEFGTSILVNAATTAEDSALERLRKGARREAEHRTLRYLLTQTWDFVLNEWPAKDYIELPGGNLQTVSSVKWKDTDGTELTLTEGTDYLVETNGDRCGRVVLPYGVSWPSGTLYPSNPITIRFVAGWTTAAAVPEDIITAILFIAENRYYHGDREEALNRAIDSLLFTHRLWKF